MYTENRCCVRHDGQHSDWFHVKKGMREGCIISPLLFLTVINWVMRRATSDRPRGLAWGLVERLEDSDFEDDIGLLSQSHKDIQEKTDLVDRTARTVGLKIHPAKTKFMKVKSRSRKPVTVKGKELEEVQDFKYRGNFISADSNIDREVSCRIGQAAQAFKRLNSIWKSTILHTRTTLKIYKSNVRSVS